MHLPFGRDILSQLDNKPRNEGNNGFGSYWIYGLIALVLIGLNAYQWGSTDKKDIDWQKYEQLLKDGDISKVTTVNEKQLHIFLKEDRLAKNGLQKSKFPNRPNFYMEIPQKVYVKNVGARRYSYPHKKVGGKKTPGP